MVLRVEQFDERRQQLPACGERFSQPATVRQHSDDTKDPDRTIVCVFTWGHPRGHCGTPDAPPLQHRAPGAPRLRRQSLTAKGRSFVCLYVLFHTYLLKYTDSNKCYLKHVTTHDNNILLLLVSWARRSSRR